MTSPWWHVLYDDLLADALLDRRDSVVVDETVSFLIQRLGLDRGMSVLDQCCGIGSLSVPLAERGLRVVGVDQCERYIDRAGKAGRARRLDLELHVADAFKFVPARPMNAAFNWWTSFGYTPDDRQNARMLERAYESLLPGGRFAIDYLNVPGVLRSFRADTVTRHLARDGEVVLHRSSTIDAARGTMENRWTYFLPDGRRVTHDSSLRLYLPYSLGEMLSMSGFRDLEFYGSPRGEPLTMDSPRLIIVARRPGHEI